MALRSSMVLVIIAGVVVALKITGIPCSVQVL